MSDSNASKAYDLAPLKEQKFHKCDGGVVIDDAYVSVGDCGLEDWSYFPSEAHAKADTEKHPLSISCGVSFGDVTFAPIVEAIDNFLDDGECSDFCIDFRTDLIQIVDALLVSHAPMFEGNQIEPILPAWVKALREQADRIEACINEWWPS